MKLLRTVLLAPLLLVIAWAWTRSEGGSVSTEAARKGLRKAIPFFVIGFVVLAGARTLGYVDAETALNADPLIRGCFLVALAGLGLQTRLGNVRVLGPRPFLLGIATSTLLAGGTLAAILAFGLGPARTEVAQGVEPGPVFSAGPSAAAVDEVLTGRVLATGIPGAGALSPVGDFHPGGPMHDQDDFAATTEEGEILDPDRLLVASTSNFGARRRAATGRRDRSSRWRPASGRRSRSHRASPPREVRRPLAPARFSSTRRSRRSS